MIPPPFFFVILGRSVGLKKKKNHKKSWNRMPWYPRTTSWINKIHNILFNVPVFVPVFLYAVTMLISRLKELFPTLTKSLLCFFENAKNLGQSDDAKRS